MRRARTLRAALLAAAALAAGASCRPAAPPPPWNVVVVLVDTLRADHLSSYGYARHTSPQLDAFADDAVRFTDVHADAGCTYPSTNSLLTSRPAAWFVAREREHGMTIPADTPSLATVLQRRGWDTAAISASIIVRRTPTVINPLGGFAGGFRVFDESCFEGSAACIGARAQALLPRLRAPFLLYLHYVDPHAPYRPPAWAPRPFAHPDPSWPAWVRQGEPKPIVRRLYHDGGGRGFTADDVRHLVDDYDDEIAFFDRSFGELLAALRRDPRWERTLLVVLADHGEEFLEHGHYGHCRSLAFDTVLRTPLLLRIPGVRGGERVTAPVSNVDVLPTVLDYLGVPAPPGIAGGSLRRLIDGAPPGRRWRIAQQGTVVTLDDGRYKVMHDLGTGVTRLFDLRVDPGERHDLAAAQPALLRERRDALLRWVAQQPGDRAGLVRQANEREAALRAVGYL